MNEQSFYITDRAKNDIRAITDYIAKDNKQAAKMMSEYFYKICALLADFPLIGIIRPDFTYKEYRFYVVKKRYIIAYRIENNMVIISRVLSGYQDICELL